MSKNKNSTGPQAPSPQPIEERSIQQLVEEAKRIKQIMRDGKGRISAQTALPPAQASETADPKLTDDEQCLLDAMLLAGDPEAPTACACGWAREAPCARPMAALSCPPTSAWA